MNVLIDIGHPAHVHYFRNTISQLKKDGYGFLIMAREKEMAQPLLEHYGFEFTSRGRGGDGLLGKAIYTVKADWQMLRLARKFQPDLFLGFGSPYCAHVARFMRKKCIIIDDTENAKLGQSLYRPFADWILSPECFKNDFGVKHIRFRSYMELAYLHPNVFQADEGVRNEVGLANGEKYTVLRFVGWGAAHDRGHTGITAENKVRAVREFERFGRVFITSEGDLPPELEDYRLRIPHHRIHDLLAYASLFYGESATMASESAVLGTPAVYLDNAGRGYTDEQEEKYGLVFNFTESDADQSKSIEKGVEILNSDSAIWKRNREKLISENIDLSAYLIDIIRGLGAGKKVEEITGTRAG